MVGRIKVLRSSLVMLRLKHSYPPLLVYSYRSLYGKGKAGHREGKITICGVDFFKPGEEFFSSYKGGCSVNTTYKSWRLIVLSKPLYCMFYNRGRSHMIIGQFCIANKRNFCPVARRNICNLSIVSRYNHPIKAVALNRCFDRISDDRFPAKVSYVFARNPLAAASGRYDGDIQASTAFRNAACTRSCSVAVKPGYMGRLIASE